MDWELISFIKRSKQRMLILENFHSSITPSELAKRTNLSPSHISRTLKELEANGLVICKTPKAHIGKIYTLTEKGEEIQEVIKGGELADKYSEDTK
ncbi:winged helix-turn-helix transcriptional regulator [Candidatus Woesearchaeota archaeon]|nr:winged helix-turn-helix transcriptional regulator [Candidatus Woesearchaeota archaeon]